MSKRRRAITKYCLAVCRFIEKRHGVCAGASVVVIVDLPQAPEDDLRSARAASGRRIC